MAGAHRAGWPCMPLQAHTLQAPKIPNPKIWVGARSQIQPECQRESARGPEQRTTQMQRDGNRRVRKLPVAASQLSFINELQKQIEITKHP